MLLHMTAVVVSSQLSGRSTHTPF